MATKTYYDTSYSATTSNDSDLLVVQQGSPLASDLSQMKKTTVGTIRQPLVNAINAKYTKPGYGIPESDLSAEVQTKLNTSSVTDVQVNNVSVLDGTVAKIDLTGKVDKTTTVNGHALSSNVTVSASDIGLGNVGNFKAVSTVASQGLTDAEKANAIANIGAGTITGITMNGSSKGTSGVVDLGTVITTHQDISGKTNTSVLPNDSYNKKTKFRIANQGNTGGGSTYWYYPLCKLPTDNAGNCASAIIKGRVGGWEAGNMASIEALAWNRGSTGIAHLSIAGSASSMSAIYSKCDIAIYTNDDTTDTVYLKCASYFTFDVDIEMFGDNISILYDGTYTTSPAGTLNALASTSSRRIEVVNGTELINGSAAEIATNKVTSISSSSTDTQYPSAKCVYDYVNSLENSAY